MDGNGRWAQSRGLPRIKGHEAGAESVRDIVRASREWGIKVLTLYSFSTENWNRPADEVAGLMSLLTRYVVEERREILDNGIRLNAIGQIDRLPLTVRLPLRELMRVSASNTGMVLNLALSYGGRQELVDAARELARRVSTGRLRLEQIDEAAITSVLSTADSPQPLQVPKNSPKVIAGHETQSRLSLSTMSQKNSNKENKKCK